MNVRFPPIADISLLANIARMTDLFWRLAFKRYNHRKPSRTFELVTLWFGSLMGLMYLISVYLNPVLSNGLRLLAAVLIVVVGMAHRRVRLEREKGPNALYQKMLSVRG